MLVKPNAWTEGLPAQNTYRYHYGNLRDWPSSGQVVSFIDWWLADRPYFGPVTKEMKEVRKATMLEF